MTQDNVSTATMGGTLDRLVAFARRRPGAVLASVLALHLVVWTLLPALLSENLHFDLVENLALGKEWQIGYWKHPPLPWWAGDLATRLTGRFEALYLLGSLSVLLCFYAVWLLAREVAGEFTALIAVLALEAINFYNFSAVKFSHDQIQLPFWAFTSLFFYRALIRGRLTDWALAGMFLAGAFWSKYAAFVLAATLGLFLLFDPQARRAWRTPGPWVMAAAFALVIAPNAWWLVHNEFMPFQFVDERARAAAHWYQYVLYPLQWTGSQALGLAPALALLALLYRRADLPWPPASDATAAFNRRYVTALALGPFLLTTVVATVLGRLVITRWGYPLWTFAPLALLLWLRPGDDPVRLRRYAAGAIAALLAYPLVYIAAEIGEPFLRDRQKGNQFPGQAMADAITRAWRDAYGTPLIYAGGTEIAVHNLAVYSPDRPHVLPHVTPKFGPWIDMNDLRRRGAVLVWEDGDPEARFDEWRKTLGPFDIQPLLVLPRQTWHPVKPVGIGYAFVPPRP
jgi:4-amino-4-deoxy-L-arabinose transferase-like glycosyltransferase